MNDRHIIGITGKIGCGKSATAKILEKQGATRIDCDKIVDKLYQTGQPGAIKIHAFFEGTYLRKDGSVNRNKLLRTLFKHPKKWEILNRMIHPLVAEEIKQQLARIEDGLIVLEIPIYENRLFEKFLDELWIIQCDDSTQTKRLKERELMPAQIKIFNKQHHSAPHPKTIIIHNNGTLKDLETKIKDKYNTLNE
jgi:dephospho-CoA kinase